MTRPVRSGVMDATDVIEAMGRRHFLAACGTAVLGLSAVIVTGCGGTTEQAAPNATGNGATAPLAGVSMEVRSDPG